MKEYPFNFGYGFSFVVLGKSEFENIRNHNETYYDDDTYYDTKTSSPSRRRFEILCSFQGREKFVELAEEDFLERFISFLGKDFQVKKNDNVFSLLFNNGLGSQIVIESQFLEDLLNGLISFVREKLRKSSS